MNAYYRVNDLKLGFTESEEKLKFLCAKACGIKESDISELRIYRKSLDLRKGKEGKVYSVDIKVKKGLIKSKKIRESENLGYKYSIPKIGKVINSPVVVGFGPSGIFCALLLARAGLSPIIIERGKMIDDRVIDVERFINGGELCTESNVQFGEGGAGAFSDGKLNTLLSDKNYRGRFVISEFIKSGAPKEIEYLAKPHIGTDIIRECVKNIRKEIISLGGKFFFETKFLSFELKDDAIFGIKVSDKSGERIIECETVFLAIGHSARDTFRNLIKQNIPMEKKPFSVGVRIEHRQKDINKARYKEFCDLISDPADYKLAVKTENGRTLYTFCMCPGGAVIPSTSDENRVVTNGMSNFARDGENANSALLCSVDTDAFEGIEDAIAFQESLEEKAFKLGGGEYAAPCQLAGDFISDNESNTFGKVKPSYGRGVKFAKIKEIFPRYISETLALGIKEMGKLIPGFDSPDAVLTAVESRSTSPIRIMRNDDHSSSIKGLYPIGEGAGYAGGIMSSAIDGMKAAEKYFEAIKNA